MPFGLVNASPTFARCMADIFRDLDFVLVYLDDILVMSKSHKEHCHHLDQVLSRLKEHQLIDKEKKCRFFQREVQFLGCNLSARGIKPLQDKCERDNALPICKTVKEAQRFLGMIKYYRRFIPQCSQIARPIIDFVAKKTTWGSFQDSAFKK
ncbi:hypothetical protein HG536_0C02160 [Torulaspora globosa]|uniref:Reverse transcriptase domain-containing protein n=1 Tax=Torulaspora globosa TaxID=48254 RepID=A0A7G3ZEW1_9SACH|nr:uncharacterized protein HG536_0C02160 [Torulaspora globosa]QLL32047.1 hypothetical protein HG536_0C02160 [Torulaspora globosa]